MKTGMIILSMCLLFACAAAGAAEVVEGPKQCQQCGMDRAAFARSRMLIEYADGGVVGVCSLHCAALDMNKNRDRRVNSLKVADYATGELLDAGSATWVVGGGKSGVMTELPKWAFAREADARMFVKENGGKLTTFGEALKAANEEVAKLEEEHKSATEEVDKQVEMPGQR
jgi:hypothetical protein